MFNSDVCKSSVSTPGVWVGCVSQVCSFGVCSSVVGILYLQFLQQFEFALHLSSSVGIISESIDEHLKKHISQNYKNTTLLTTEKQDITHK